MAPIDNSKWAVLRELALARFSKDAEVADTMRWAKELASHQLGDAATFVAAPEAVQAEEEKRVGEALLVVNRQRCRLAAGGG
jgi:hypothetical protein